jgi:hypothetical protein
MTEEKGVYLVEIIKTYHMNVKKSDYEAYRTLEKAQRRFCELGAANNFENVGNLRLHAVSVPVFKDDE